LTVKEALEFGCRFLSEKGAALPRLDAEQLLAAAIGSNRTFLFAHPERLLSSQEEEKLRAWLDLRGEGCPIQHLLGYQEFYGRSFTVSPAVLIPRPETELLVAASLEILQACPAPRVHALDLGTGSGCIAVSLACESPCLRVTATDLSASALEVARHNADRHGCSGRIEFLQGDLLAPVRGRHNGYHLIVSNPPYVARHCDRIDPAVARYEPESALFAGETGLEFYARILEEAGGVLKSEGYLVLELGLGLAESVVQISRRFGWSSVELRKDLAGIDRCLVLSLPGGCRKSWSPKPNQA
jgi:release factor glutamine methyltransferase